jgi:hypothetical protein
MLESSVYSTDVRDSQPDKCISCCSLQIIAAIGMYVTLLILIKTSRFR